MTTKARKRREARWIARVVAEHLCPRHDPGGLQVARQTARRRTLAAESDGTAPRRPAEQGAPSWPARGRARARRANQRLRAQGRAA